MNEKKIVERLERLHELIEQVREGQQGIEKTQKALETLTTCSRNQMRAQQLRMFELRCALCEVLAVALTANIYQPRRRNHRRRVVEK